MHLHKNLLINVHSSIILAFNGILFHNKKLIIYTCYKKDDPGKLFLSVEFKHNTLHYCYIPFILNVHNRKTKESRKIVAYSWRGRLGDKLSDDCEWVDCFIL